MTTPDTQFVFVYGTLRRGGTNHHLVERWADTARTDAIAPDLAMYAPAHRHFPYALFQPGGHGVQGDLLRIPARQWHQAVATLDALEGYDPHKDPRLNHYTRTTTRVLVDGHSYTAWVYLAGPRVEAERLNDMTHMPSGIWPPTQPAPGALLIEPNSHVGVYRLGEDPATTITELLGSPGEATITDSGLQIWQRIDTSHGLGHEPNPLASLALATPEELELLAGPVAVCANHLRELPRPRVAALLEHCFLLAGHDHAMTTAAQAGTVWQQWFSHQR